MVSENVIGLILAAAVTFILILLMISLFSPTFNKGKEGAESYFDSLENAINEVDDVGRSSFFMLDLSDEELEFYLVYFGEAFVFVNDLKEFVRSPRDGSLCVCYEQGEKVLCDDCVDLDGAVSYNEAAPWVIREGEYVNINKKGDNYAFVRS
jgi:hypothetical protein